MAETKNISRNLFWGFLFKFISLVLPFITRTVLLKTLGIDYIGLGNLFSSIFHVLNFTELGIGSAITNTMYKPMALHDDKKICAIMNLHKKIYLIIGFITLVLGLLLIPWIHVFISGEVPADINLKLLFIIFLFEAISGYIFFGYKQSLFYAAQRVDIINKTSFIITIISHILKIIVLIISKNYYLYTLVLPLITVSNHIIINILANKKFPQYKCYGQVSKEEKKEIEKKVKGMIFQKVGYIIISSADTIVISAFLGLHVLGIYNGYYYVIMTLFGFIGIIHQSLIPAIGKKTVIDSVENNLKDFHKYHFLFMWLINWCCACLLCLYQPFITLWQGSENTLSNGLVILLCIYFFTNKMIDVNWMYKEALGLWWESRFIPLISSIVNLVLNIVLVKTIGLPGILISTIVALTIINFPWSSKVIFSIYFKSKKEWLIYILKTLFYFIAMILVSFATLYICKLLSVSGILNFILRILICIFVPNILLLIINLINPDFKRSFQFFIAEIKNFFVIILIKFVVMLQ